MMRDSPVIGYVPVFLPTKEEGKMYLDLTFPIRGIIFPLAQNAGPDYEVSDHVGVNLRSRMHNGRLCL